MSRWFGWLILALALTACGGRGRVQTQTSKAASSSGSASPSGPTGRPTGRASVRPSDVEAALVVRIHAVARYCNAPRDRLAPCRPGQQAPVGGPERLIELSFIARRTAVSRDWYSWNIEAPRQCLEASAGGPTRSPVKAGALLTFDVLLPPDCRGTVHAEAFYWTQALTADVERGTRVGQRIVAVQ
jgi:hypothetical protein